LVILYTYHFYKDFLKTKTLNEIKIKGNKLMESPKTIIINGKIYTKEMLLKIAEYHQKHPNNRIRRFATPDPEKNRQAEVWLKEYFNEMRRLYLLHGGNIKNWV